MNFPLLADTDRKIADAYGVKMMDRNMARRVSFLIGLDGKIAHVTDTPSADTHLSERKEAVEKPKGNSLRIRQGLNPPPTSRHNPPRRAVKPPTLNRCIR